MWKYIKQFLPFMILAAACMLVEVGVDLLQPSLMSKIVDEGVLGTNQGGVGNMDVIIRYGVAMVALVLLGGLGGASCSLFSNIVRERSGNLMRKDVFRQILRFSFPQIDDYGTGALITRVTNDITQVQNMLTQMVRGAVRTCCMFLGSIFFLFRLYPSYGMVVLGALPLVLLAVFLCLHKAAPYFTAMQSQLDDLNAIMQEDISGIRIIKACVREWHEKRRFQDTNDVLIRTNLHVLTIFAFMTPIMNVLMYIVIAVILLLSGSTGGATPGAAMGAITYTTQLLHSILGLVNLFQNISRGTASWKRVQEILHTEPELKNGTMESVAGTGGTVELRNVSFAYAGTRQKVLEEVNLTIAPGETLAIMGATGCGKTTLVHLIARFYDATEGQVLVDGVDVRDYDQQALRGKISIALQNAELFSDTIRENISWGRENATEPDIRRAAQIAQAAEFIEKSEQGYNTVLAERGMSLSGGQRQRLSLARAVLRESPILILDDATSALDLKTEADFYDALNASHPHCTKILVAQRISSVRRADRIVILEGGRIADCGTHDQLLSRCAIYQDIYQSQIGNEVL